MRLRLRLPSCDVPAPIWEAVSARPAGPLRAVVAEHHAYRHRARAAGPPPRAAVPVPDGDRHARRAAARGAATRPGPGARHLPRPGRWPAHDRRRHRARRRAVRRPAAAQPARRPRAVRRPGRRAGRDRPRRRRPARPPRRRPARADARRPHLGRTVPAARRGSRPARRPGPAAARRGVPRLAPPACVARHGAGHRRRARGRLERAASRRPVPHRDRPDAQGRRAGDPVRPGAALSRTCPAPPSRRPAGSPTIVALGPRLRRLHPPRRARWLATEVGSLQAADPAAGRDWAS